MKTTKTTKTTMKLTFILMMLGVMVSLPVKIFAAGERVNLIYLHETESDYVKVVENGIVDSYGNSYSGNILRFETNRGAYITYDLNGQYDSFVGTIVCGEKTSGSAEINLGIYADGEKVYELKGYTRQKAAASFNIDVSGVGKLSIKAAKNSSSSSYVYFTDSYLEKSDTSRDYPKRMELNDLVAIDSKNCTVSKHGIVDSYGNIHGDWIRLESNGYVLFNLDNKFESFSGSIVSTEKTGKNSVMNIDFYLDDELVYSKKGISKTSSQIDFNIDVSDARVLKITSSKSGGLYNYIYVVDSILKSHEHALADWETLYEATCTENGKRVRICEKCAETVDFDTIPCKGHSPDTKWTETSAANCVRDGEKVCLCTVCGEIALATKTPAVGHNPEINWTVETEATCTNMGKQIKKCTVCKEIVQTEFTDKIAHTLTGNWEYADDGTCNKIQKCIVCGNVAERQTDDEKQHVMVEEWTVIYDAKCYEEGKKVKYCSKCNEIAEEEIIPVIEHKYGDWEIISGSIWNNPIVKKHYCEVCSYTEVVESNSTAWVKPVVIISFLVIVVGLIALLVVSFVRYNKKITK